MNCLASNRGFFLHFPQLSKSLELGIWRWIWPTSSSCSWGQWTIRGTAPPSTLSQSITLGVTALSLRPEATWVLFSAPACPARMLPPPAPSSFWWASKARYRGGMRLPQEINFNWYRNWLQDSTEHWVSTCRENLAVSDFIFHWNPPLAFSRTGHTKQIDF